MTKGLPLQLGWSRSYQLYDRHAEVQPYASILQHLQSIAPALSAHGVPAARADTSGGAARARVPMLGSVHRDVVLPIGAGPVAARDLRRLGELRGPTPASGGDGAA